MSMEICRAFTLYHNKIIVNQFDSIPDGELEKDYDVIGYFDWFSTKKLDIKNHDELSELFNYNSLLNEKGSAFQSFQNVFGFRNDEKSGGCSDIDFWESESNAILYFVLYIQLEKYNETLFDLIEKVLYEKLDKDSFIVYYTLDKNDFVICFKSRLYKNVIEAINHLYLRMQDEKHYIIYSYTNFMVKHGILNDKDRLLQCLMTESNEIERIDSICIKTILNDYNKEVHPITEKIDFFCKNLSKELYGSEAEKKEGNRDIVGYEILGDTDCRFIARDVPIDNLLMLFSDQGILNTRNEVFKYCFISSMTSLNVGVIISNEYRINILENKKLEPVSFIERDRITSIKKEIGNDYLSLVTLLYQVYDYIRFIGCQTSKYEFLSLKSSFETLISLIENNISMLKKSAQQFVQLYDYLSSMYTNIQENMRTDVRFYGISDFSMMSYYSPTKLRVFYSSIVNKIAEYYIKMCPSDTSTKYRFMIFFTYTPNTYVDQLWKERYNEDKLMMVKISEKDFYNVKDLVFQLAHESAHFVGNEEIRNRKYRFTIIIEYLFFRAYEHIKEIIDTHFKQIDDNDGLKEYIDLYLNELKKECYNDYYKSKYKYIYERTVSLINDLINNREISKEDEFFYMQNVIYSIADFLFNNDFLLIFINDFFMEAWNKTYKKMICKSSSKTIIKVIKAFVKHIEEIRIKISKYLNLYRGEMLYSKDSDFMYLQTMMKEAYADMSAVLLFNLSVEELFSFVNKRFDLSGDYTNDVLFIRSCIIVKAIANKHIEHSEILNSSYSDFFKEIPGYWSDKKQNYENIIKLCDKLDEQEFPSHYVYKYILQCLNSQCKQVNIEKRTEISNSYSSLDNENIIDTIKFIDSYVGDMDLQE